MRLQGCVVAVKDLPRFIGWLWFLYDAASTSNKAERFC